uniref:C3H1-type domain-containing protein n=1 Tax=Glossina palpalis gambiensis TaxID=67801 RepID=A0A1B0BWL6_9MUSC
MTEKEMQAHDNVRWRNWPRAVTLYDQILNSPPYTQTVNSRSLKDRHISCLLGRCECLLELGKYELCLNDARKIISMLSEQQTDCLASVSRTRRWLVHSLCKLKKYPEAEHILREWVSELTSQPVFVDICKTLERYKSVIHMLSSNKSSQKITHTRLEDEMSILDTKLDHWATNNLPLDKFSKLLSNKGIKKRENQTHNGAVSNPVGLTGSSSTGNLQKTTDFLAGLKVSGSKSASEDSIENSNSTTCSYCAITFNTRIELRQHCQTEAHQNVIMSDEGRDWKWRPPPRGYTLDSYGLCESWSEFQTCHYGNQCVEAHGQDELNEWKERFEYRRMRVQKAWEKELYGKSYTEEILERWIQSTAPEKIMCEKIVGIEAVCEQDLVTSISSKSSKREWIFVLKTAGNPLRAVALLQDAHRSHFGIKSIKIMGSNEELELKTNQEWVHNKHSAAALVSSSTIADSGVKEEEMNDPRKEEIEPQETMNSSPTSANNSPLEYQITLEFHTEIYGTFRQAVCFDFGTEPLLVRHLCVDVVPVNDAEKIEEIKRDIINSSATRWDVSNTNLVKFETTLGTHLKTEAYLNDLKHEKEMLERYPCPRAQTFTLTQSTILEKRLTQNNYRSRIHELLYVEEIARYEQIARFNLSTKLTVTSNYILTPAGMATSTAKYSLSGELFALMHLGKDISEDTSAGRLILSNCSSVYISPVEEGQVKDKKRNVYEALIEDKGKNVIYLKLSAKCVESMKLKADTEIHVDIQFQLNRLPYCEWHHAVDKITDFKIIFPVTDIEPSIPWTPKKQWSETCEPKLNAKQREAVNAITTSLGIKLPPILLIGPFGTGKTYTLAQAIKQLLVQPEAKILICTHSNSAADLYIKEYLHPWIEEGFKEAIPLRVYYHKRWVATVNGVVQKYCVNDGAGNFRRPTVDDIMKYRIVVVTLNISMELANLDIPKGYFTHIFLDEAAQAMECEAIMPLALANESTRIVLAGDHMQMSPELFSAFAKERKLHISLLERLYDHYPSNFPCKILLCENYRAHEVIIKFTSELFYEQKLIASGKQPRHEKFYPLTFFTTRGEDVQDKNSTAFYNNAEVYELVERVSELRKKWPTSWGKINDASIGIMTPYADQVFRIRSELRKRRMGGISVERVLNVQGKQFRAVFLSTVRTRRTCMPNGMAVAGFPGQSFNPVEDADYGFLSNSKLLNTAFTRAQSLVAVVGDPVALCSIGRCRKVWERFIQICHENKSLFGITMWQLRSQLDGVELKKGYVLNPLAPEFIPRSLQPEAYLRDQAAMYLAMAGIANNHHPLGPHAGSLHGPGTLGPHPGLLAAGGHGSIPPHHPANMASQHIPHMYGPHTAAAAYNVAAAAAAMMNQGLVPSKGGHNFSSHPNHMPMRAIGPPPPSGPQTVPQPGPPMATQQFNPRGPPPLSAVHMGQPPTPYMPWHTQPSLRGGPPGTGQQPGLPGNQNPNATLWGPPPQTNPWSALPKQPPMSQPPNASGVPPNSRQMPPQQPVHGVRGTSVPLQPPNLTNPQTMRNNPSDLGYLANKALYGKQHPGQGTQISAPPQSHVNFPTFSYNVAPNQLQMINQRNITGIPNGPVSPMDSFMQRPPTGSTVGAAQASFFGQSNMPGGLKEKEFQLLNNVHLPPLNIGANLFPIAAPNMMANAANNKQQSPTTLRFPLPNEYASVLPPNMNIYEMAFESKDLQYKWYLKLLEIQGQEAANKFTDALRQVTAALQQQSNPNLKPSQHLQGGPHLHAGNQLISRDLMQQQPMIAYPQQQPQQQQPRTAQPFMGATAIPPLSNLMQPPLTLTVANDETPPLDGNINFNQQIDMVFNSIINGNEISQPILRDLFGVGGGGSNSTDINGELLPNATPPTANNSKLFPGTGMGAGLLSGQSNNLTKNPLTSNMFTLHSIPPQQHQAPLPTVGSGSAFLGNNTLLNNKEFLLGSNIGEAAPAISVPLYRRQGMTMGNAHNINSAGNSANTTAGQSLSSSAPDNIFTNCNNDILAGLGTGTAGNLLDSLFQNNPHQDMQPQQQQSLQPQPQQTQHPQHNSNFQKLLYNNFNSPGIKHNDMDTFVGNNTFATNPLADGVNNSFHNQMHQQKSNALNSTGPPNNTIATADTRSTTYAAVLSQRPQQPDVMQHNITSGSGGGGGGAALNISGTSSASNNIDGSEKDPFAAIRELGQGTNGFYNYFQ